MLNKVQLIGRLGQNPETGVLPNSGKPTVKLSIATSEFSKGEGGARKETTTWHNCVAYDKTAELIGLYTRKGSLVFVEGSLRTREWEDKNNGGKRKAIEIVVRDIKFLDPKPAASDSSFGSSDSAPAPASPGFDAGDDDIPF